MALNKFVAHANNMALHHTVFALPFAYMGAVLAARGLPEPQELLWITVAMVGARSAAMGLNNLIDLKYDKLHPRFVKRPMVTGAVKPGEVIALILGSFAVFFYAAAQLAPICIQLAPFAVLPFVIYPYTKRFTWGCHFVLGLSLAMAPLGGWVAIRGDIALPVAFLGLAVGIWIAAFDAIYGCQDAAFDQAHDLHSLATRFTVPGALRLARCMHLFSIACFIAVGCLLALTPVYYIGVAIGAVTLCYQHAIVSAADLSRVTQVYFMRNGIVGISIFLCTFVSLL